LRSDAGGARRIRCQAPKRSTRRRHSRLNLNPVIAVEEAEPGTALDVELRREQSKAILDLLRAYRHQERS